MTGARLPRAWRPAPWQIMATLAVGVAALRLASADAAWSPLLTLGWGLLCVAALGVGAHQNRGRGRLAWSLFSASVLCGTLSMALYPFGLQAAPIETARVLLDLGAYAFGAAGIAVFIRDYGGADPDAWLDAAAVGVALSVLMFQFVLVGQAPVLATGRDVGFAVMVAAVDAAIFTALARFVIRPIASRPVSFLAAVIAVVLIIDAGYYSTVGMPRPVYEAMWLLAYGAWAAGGIHPDVSRLEVAVLRPARTVDEEIRSASTSIVLHSAGFIATLTALLAHMATSGSSAFLFIGAFLLQILLVSTRSARVLVRLREDDRRRAEAERALRTSEERFRRLAEVAPVGIFVTDATGASTFQNEAWAQTAGVPAADGLGTGYLRTIHPDDAELAVAAWQEATRSGAVLRIEQRMLRPDGSIRWVQTQAVPVQDAAGSVDGFVGTVADVTELIEARAAAMEREAFVSGLIEQAPVGIEIFGPDGRSMSANHAQRRIRSLLAPGEAVAPDVREDALMARLGQAAAIGRAFAGAADGSDTPIHVQRQDAGDAGDVGTDLWLRMTWFPLRDGEGRVVAVVSFTEDVTPAAQAETERRAVEGKLREAAKLEALGVLAGGIAHDFNNLLVAILGHASLARAQVEADSPVDQDLASVEMAARRAADLARQMLAYSGRGSFVVGPLSIEGLLREMGDLLGRSIAKSATLRHEFAPGLPPVLADATQIRQVALNLIVNASDALGDRPGTITLRTGMVTLAEDDPDVVPGIPVTPGRYVLLEVADSGRGMDARTRARIFDPFFTTKATGRGLGLAATLGIVKGHGGALRVRSVPGEGTRFEVLLRPVAADAMWPATPAAAPLPAAAGSESRPAGRILIVDDEPTVRQLGRRVLERAGYEVVEAVDGPEGIAAFAAAPECWEGVLLDLTLPTLDGMSVLAAMRDLRADIPAVICSGWAAEEVTERLASTPWARVVEKPYAPAALIEAFRALAKEGPGAPGAQPPG